MRTQQKKNKVQWMPIVGGILRGRTVHCAKDWLFSTTGSHGSRGPEFCTLQPLVVHQGICFRMPCMSARPFGEHLTWHARGAEIQLSGPPKHPQFLPRGLFI